MPKGYNKKENKKREEISEKNNHLFHDRNPSDTRDDWTSGSFI